MAHELGVPVAGTVAPEGYFQTVDEARARMAAAGVPPILKANENDRG